MLTNYGVVLEIRGGSRRQLYPGFGRPIDMVQRGSTLWVAYDNGLVVLRAGEPPEVLGPAEDVPSGGPLLVDREGSLWLGTYRGLRQFPAPETVALAPSAARRLAVSSEGIWVDSWSGHSLIRRDGGRFLTEHIPGSVTSDICAGNDGAVWTGYKGRYLERREGRFNEHPRPDLDAVVRCSAGRDGRIWMTTGVGLALARRDALPCATCPGRRRQFGTAPSDPCWRTRAEVSGSPMAIGSAAPARSRRPRVELPPGAAAGSRAPA